ncbi:MAG: glycosyltransferase family 9 protein [Alphaproteobacteria bacterium]|nr:glycosyltransferase family 9 protein [Alphaproteobacteria bacterium]
MNILFITSSRIGDAVLSTGLLNHIQTRWPAAKVTIACGTLAVSLFDGYPLRARTIAMKKEKYNKHWIKLWRQVIATRWDMVIDLRDSAVSRLVWAGQRYIFSPRLNKDKKLHKAEQNAAVMGLENVPDPKLWFSAAQTEKAAHLIPDGAPVLGVGPTANWIGKTWPAERFIETVSWLTAPDGYMAGARVAVFGAPGEEEEAHKVLQSIPEERRLDIIAKTDPGTAAATIARCDFYIGNDSGLMHCAAAAGVPTLGLFGPSYDSVYRPWGTHAHFVRTPESFDELIDFEGYDPKTLTKTLMGSLTLEAVQSALDEMFLEQKNKAPKTSASL